MVEILFGNKKKIMSDFNIHDALISHFDYNYEEKTIYLELDNSTWGYDIKINFVDVLYFEVQSCCF